MVQNLACNGHLGSTVNDKPMPGPRISLIEIALRMASVKGNGTKSNYICNLIYRAIRSYSLKIEVVPSPESRHGPGPMGPMGPGPNGPGPWARPGPMDQGRTRAQWARAMGPGPMDRAIISEAAKAADFKGGCGGAEPPPPEKSSNFFRLSKQSRGRC